MNSLFLSVLLALLLRIDSLGKASAVMRSVFRLGRGHHYLVARIVIDVDSDSPELRPVLTEKLSFRPLCEQVILATCCVMSVLVTHICDRLDSKRKNPDEAFSAERDLKKKVFNVVNSERKDGKRGVG